MIWLWLLLTGMLNGFALHQLLKNYLANKIVRRSSPLNLGVAVERLSAVCKSYVDLVDEANRMVGVRTSPTNYLVASHLIYSLGSARSAVTSLSTQYLIPGHAEYQVHGLRYWVKEIYPILHIVASFSKDSAHIKELCTEDNKVLIATWQKNADTTIGLLENIKEFIENGVGG